MRDDRFIVLSNDEQRIYRLFDTHERSILRRFRLRLTATTIACAASRHFALTGQVPTWPWEPTELNQQGASRGQQRRAAAA